MKNLCRFDESCFQFVNKALLTNHLCKETWHARSFLKNRFSWQVLRENRACERKHLKTKTLIERYLRNTNTKLSWRERLYQANQQTEQWLITVVLNKLDLNNQIIKFQTLDEKFFEWSPSLPWSDSICASINIGMVGRSSFISWSNGRPNPWRQLCPCCWLLRSPWGLS